MAEREKPVRVLVIAPYCDGTDVGEAWSNCQWVRTLAARHEITLLTLRKAGAPSVAGQIPGARVIEWSDFRYPHRCDRLVSMLKPGYAWFYRKARRWIAEARRRGERFDLGHQLSPLALRYPSPLVGFRLPYVIGPLGGSLDTPLAFRSECNSDPWYVRLRSLDRARLSWDPFLRRTYRDAAAVIGVAPYVRDLLASIPIRRFEVTSETGIWSLPEVAEYVPPTPGSARLLFVGRLIRSKAARDAIRALAALQDLPGVTLDIVGDGPDRSACESEVAQNKLQARVRLHGRVSRAECERFYSQADLFVFPSFREPSGNVVFEALSWGLPVIASDRGGPAHVVDSSCGVVVTCHSPEQYARDIAAAIRDCVSEPEGLKLLSDGARRRVASIGLWNSKADWLSGLYESIYTDSANVA